MKVFYFLVFLLISIALPSLAASNNKASFDQNINKLIKAHYQKHQQK